jgi:hypothetical protein
VLEQNPESQPGCIGRGLRGVSLIVKVSIQLGGGAEPPLRYLSKQK